MPQLPVGHGRLFSPCRARAGRFRTTGPQFAGREDTLYAVIRLRQAPGATY